MNTRFLCEIGAQKCSTANLEVKPDNQREKPNVHNVFCGKGRKTFGKKHSNHSNHLAPGAPTPVYKVHMEAGLSAGICDCQLSPFEVRDKKFKDSLTGSSMAGGFKKQDPISYKVDQEHLNKQSTVQPVHQGYKMSYNKKTPAMKSIKCNMRQILCFFHIHDIQQHAHLMSCFQLFDWNPCCLKTNNCLVLFPAVV